MMVNCRAELSRQKRSEARGRLEHATREFSFCPDQRNYSSYCSASKRTANNWSGRSPNKIPRYKGFHPCQPPRQPFLGGRGPWFGVGPPAFIGKKSFREARVNRESEIARYPFFMENLSGSSPDHRGFIRRLKATVSDATHLSTPMLQR